MSSSGRGVKFARKQLRLSHVSQLSLGGMCAGDDEVKVVCELLRTNTRIKILELEGNCISDEGVVHISSLLASNTTLTVLRLSNNRITDVGMEGLMQSLEKNRYLGTLNLQGNLIGDRGAVAIARMLRVNEKLTVLNLRGNEISDAGGRILRDALEKNPNIVALNLRDNGVVDTTIFARIDSFIRRNEEFGKNRLKKVAWINAKERMEMDMETSSVGSAPIETPPYLTSHKDDDPHGLKNEIALLWNLISNLRLENQFLKERVDELSLEKRRIDSLEMRIKRIEDHSE